MRAQVPKRPIMARNIGMENPRRGLGGVTRARQMTRYPKLLRKKPIRLATIEEVPEEIVHEAVSCNVFAVRLYVYWYGMELEIPVYGCMRVYKGVTPLILCRNPM